MMTVGGIIIIGLFLAAMGILIVAGYLRSVAHHQARWSSRREAELAARGVASIHKRE